MEWQSPRKCRLSLGCFLGGREEERYVAWHSVLLFWEVMFELREDKNTFCVFGCLCLRSCAIAEPQDRTEVRE